MALPKNKTNQYGERNVFEERSFGTDRQAVAKAAAVGWLTRNVSITGKKSKKQDQKQKQPAKEPDPPADQQGKTGDDLKGVHQYRRGQRYGV